MDIRLEAMLVSWGWNVADAVPIELESAGKIAVGKQPGAVIFDGSAKILAGPYASIIVDSNCVAVYYDAQQKAVTVDSVEDRLVDSPFLNYGGRIISLRVPIADLSYSVSDDVASDEAASKGMFLNLFSKPKASSPFNVSIMKGNKTEVVYASAVDFYTDPSFFWKFISKSLGLECIYEGKSSFLSHEGTNTELICRTTDNYHIVNATFPEGRNISDLRQLSSISPRIFFQNLDGKWVGRELPESNKQANQFDVHINGGGHVVYDYIKALCR